MVFVPVVACPAPSHAFTCRHQQLSDFLKFCVKNGCFIIFVNDTEENICFLVRPVRSVNTDGSPLVMETRCSLGPIWQTRIHKTLCTIALIRKETKSTWGECANIMGSVRTLARVLPVSMKELHDGCQKVLWVGASREGWFSHILQYIIQSFGIQLLCEKRSEINHPFIVPST